MNTVSSSYEAERPPSGVVAHSYIDSIVLRMPALMEPCTFRRLEQELAKNVDPAKERIYVDKAGFGGPYWHLAYYVHQPTMAALALLQEAGYTDLLAVHVALDLRCSTLDPSDLHAYMEHRLLKNARPARIGDCEHDTVLYLGRRNLPDSHADNRRVRPFRNDGSEIAVYSDQLSKIHGKWCLHLEYRIKGAQALQLEELETFEQIRGLNLREFWDERLDMRKAPDEAKLHRLCMRGFVRRGYDEERAANATKRTIFYVMRLCRGTEHAVVGSNLLAHLIANPLIAGKGPSRLFRKECHKWMLPGPTNALWTPEYEGRVAAASESQLELREHHHRERLRRAEYTKNKEAVQTCKLRHPNVVAAHPVVSCRLSDDECLEKLLQLALGSEGKCSQCDRAQKHFRVRGRAAFACGACGHHVYPQARTVFEGTRTPLSHWFAALEIILATGECGATQLAASLPISYKTACRMRTELMAAIKTGEGLPNELLALAAGATRKG